MKLGLDVHNTSNILQEHSIDKWNASNLPEVVVFAHSTEDASKCLKYAHANDIPVTTRGAGVGYVGGAVPVKGGIVLSTMKMNKILEISPEDGVVVTQPGVITGILQDAVKEKGWYYPPDPASLAECSIGGNIASNAGGPRCLKYGVTKHYVLGLTVVTADGSIMKTGGRLHKNKQGFDLTSLMVGSEGMLGVVTEANLRIIPHPAHKSILTATFEKFPTAALAVQTILNSGHHPSALEITDAFTLESARAFIGREAVPEGDAHLIIEIDGRTSAVEKELSEIVSILESLNAVTIETHESEEECAAIWQFRRDLSYSLKATGLMKLNEDVVVPRGKLVKLVNFAQKLSAETGIAISCFGHAGDGNIHTNLMFSDADPAMRKKANQAIDKLFKWVLSEGGATTGEHGVGLAKKRWFRGAVGEESYAAHLAIKKALDPKNILNPDKFLD